MKKDRRENSNHQQCQEIVALLNELIDGDIDPERESRARELIRANPQCQALYLTLIKTVELFKERRNEMNFEKSPVIKWLDLSRG